ncbi:hypothetical protein Lalb_Chr08g0239791 [Lupinus albus]|uniref:Uncharacterized protein n=1 Tax=Lupinus albus TaxID=3870 RepID=A0A6A4Q4F0_LUPAL|nr:hypothetical protein Lalb_Chr08g0239791 [Lupinus albus]
MCSKLVEEKQIHEYLLVISNLVSKATFNPILEKIQRRMATWKANLLNKVECLYLAKSLISTIPIYSMQVTRLPQNVSNDIDRMTRTFL